MKALDHLVRRGKALYVGISNYPADLARQAIDILEDLGTPCLIHQPKYSLFERWVEDGCWRCCRKRASVVLPSRRWRAGSSLTVI